MLAECVYFSTGFFLLSVFFFRDTWRTHSFSYPCTSQILISARALHQNIFALAIL